MKGTEATTVERTTIHITELDRQRLERLIELAGGRSRRANHQYLAGLEAELERAETVAPEADGRKHSYTPAAAVTRSGAEELRAGTRVRQSAETRTATHILLQRRRRPSGLRGLSAKRLSERRRLQRQASLGQGVSPR